MMIARFSILAVALLLAACSDDVGLQQRSASNRANTMQGGAIEVKPGDTVYSISRRYNVPMSTLIRENKLQQPYILQPGQSLRVPGASYEDGTGLVDNNTQANDYTAARSVEGSDLGGSAAPEPGSVATESLQPLGSSGSNEPTSLTPLPVRGAASSTPGNHEMVLTPMGPVTTPKPGEVQVPGSSAATGSTPSESDAVSVPPSTPTAVAAAAPAKGTFGWPIEGRANGANGSNGGAIDISAPKGTAITSTAGGTVLSTTSDSVTIQHANGYVSTYSPLERVLVDKDAIVAKGDAIGTLATSGGKAQLHFGIAKAGQPVDVMTALPSR